MNSERDNIDQNASNPTNVKVHSFAAALRTWHRAFAGCAWESLAFLSEI
jgi:hypothetical protein